MNRKERRADAHSARKLARKAGFPSPAPGPQQSTTTPNPTAPTEETSKPPHPPISEARLNANRQNAQSSTGPVTPAGRAASSQNRTTHGLARHNGAFKLLATEEAAGFEALIQSLAEEYQPNTATEGILISNMAESHWLASRAQSLQTACLDENSGAITNEKTFSLYLRYQTIHARAFHRCLTDLLKLRNERRKEQAGFEAQKRQEAETEQTAFDAEVEKQMNADEQFLKNPELRDLGIRLGMASRTKGPEYFELKKQFDEKWRSAWKERQAAAA